MTDPYLAASVFTTGGGNVAVDIAGGALTVKLSIAAVRLPVRELADRIMHTAREAADAARAASAEQQPLGSAADALAELKSLRDGLRGEGLEAVIERKRVEFGAEAPDPSSDDPRAMSRIALGTALPTSGLDQAIELLERFQPTPGTDAPQGNDPEPETPTGTATSPDEQVTVEATGAYPIARLRLGLHAREMGPDLLAAQITATAAQAGEDLERRQRSHIDGLGLPFTQEQIDGFPAQMRTYAKKIASQAAFLRNDHDQTLRRLQQ